MADPSGIQSPIDVQVDGGTSQYFSTSKTTVRTGRGSLIGTDLLAEHTFSDSKNYIEDPVDSNNRFL